MEKGSSKDGEILLSLKRSYATLFSIIYLSLTWICIRACISSYANEALLPIFLWLLKVHGPSSSIYNGATAVSELCATNEGSLDEEPI